MRLWSLHPAMLDRQGLLAAWREGLLAQSVIVKLQSGEKPAYRNHPQLSRFLASPVPLCLIGTWLTFIQKEATKRGYSFDKSKILEPSEAFRLIVTSGQLEYEFNHLQSKLKERDNSLYWFNYGYYVCAENSAIEQHPMFVVVDGEIEGWEKVSL